MNFPILKNLLRGGLAATALVALSAHADTTLLNVSYDVARELYKDYNPVFAKHWKEKTGETVNINQSHGGSSKQAMSVAAGLEADVVTMNQATDIDLLADRGLVSPDWRKKFPNGAAPFTTVQVFLVRKGNPKNIKDWDDLIKPGVQVVIPNPKLTGNGRYSYLAGWGAVIKKGGTPAQAKAYVTELFKHVPVLDGGGRAASVTFTQRNIGDVLVTFENEVKQLTLEMGSDKFDVVYPSVTILAEPPVAVVDKVVDKKGTRKVATEYLNYLYSEEGQAVGARNYFRVRDPVIAKRYAIMYPNIKTFT
ncbi:MAG TPA: sulfate ABC transporter substrate-binding protein, partial [Rhodocyclaceae bacterium]|nr:sulfate ABC transporter substrate-binding protein [Rhodocyclaceae bacterium]